MSILPMAPPLKQSAPVIKQQNKHVSIEELNEQALAVANELRPTLTPPATTMRALKRRLSGMRTAIGNYRLNRRLQKAGREDFRPLYFIWTTLRTCNFLCTYCDDHQGRRYPELPNDGVLDTEQGLDLLRIMRTATPSVYFAGGEPTLRKDLAALTRAAVDLNYYPVIINTNGSAVDRLLRLPQYHDWLANTDIVIVSLDALDPDVLATMWAYKKPQEVIRNLLLLAHLAKELRVKLMVNTVIQPGMIGHAHAVLDFAREHGIWFCPVPVNTGPTIAGGLLDDAEYLAFVDLILARKQAGQRISGSPRMLKRLLRGEPLQCRNTLKPHIDFDGHLIWPCKSCVNVKPERVNVLDFDSIDALFEHCRTLIEPTRFHGPALNQCGANCNWAQNYTTDAYAHGLAHPWSLMGEVTEFLRARSARGRS